MPIIDPAFEIVPFEEVAEVLGEAARRARGGPPMAINASGPQLTEALRQAGFLILRQPAGARQLTL